MAKKELNNIIAKINNLADSADDFSALSKGKDEELNEIINAVNYLSKKLKAQNKDAATNEKRMVEIQEVLNDYLLRDFSRSIKITDSKDNIDALALSINYFGQDLSESFKQINEQQEVLECKNEEISILFKEVNHRIKNNFQIINSLISIQISTLNDEKAESFFNNIKNRIYSMAKAHEMLHKSQTFSNINCRNYINDIADSIIESFNDIGTHITLTTEIDETISLNVDSFTSLGLLINEIITNSIRHAFENKEKGEINIALEKTDNNSFELRVSDNGSGVKPKDAEESNSLGLNIIDALVNQIDGVLVLSTSDKGTTYSITFSMS